MTEFYVRLQDDTCGTVLLQRKEDDLIGEEVTVELNDENGNRIQKTGIVEDIL